MDLRQLTQLVALTQERNFTRAARRLNIVQSALSTSISTLEDELSVRLFVRTTRQVTPTAAGEALYAKALDVLGAVREARLAATAFQTMQTGVLTIGTVQSLPAFIDLPSLLAAFHNVHPGIDVRLRQGSRMDLAGLIQTGQLDLAFAPQISLPKGIAQRMVVDEPMDFACASDHALARRKSVSLANLRQERFVDFQPGWGTRAVIDQYWEDDEARHIAFEVSDLDTQISLVERGLGVALVPRRNLTGRNLRAIPLDPPGMRWQMIVLHRAEADAAVQGMIGLIAV